MRVRLSSGKPATLGGGFAARPREDDEDIKPIRRVNPSSGEYDTPLACGCMIPWPVFGLLAKGRPVMCDIHGPQAPITQAEYQRLKREDAKKCPTNSSMLPDAPPF